jgi:hypothetical protein
MNNIETTEVAAVLRKLEIDKANGPDIEVWLIH